MKLLNGYGMRMVLTGVVAAVVLGGASVSAEHIWTQKADMPTPRWSHTSAVVNGKIYVIGGSTSEPGDRVLSAVEEYDPVTDTWTRKADMPTARGWISPSSAVVDGKIYVIGGWGSSGSLSIVEEYDPATDTWTRKSDMPTPRDSTATVAVEGKIYAIGGSTNSVNGINVVEQYDPMTDTWTTKTNMTTAVWGLCACVLDGKVYALGGRPGYNAILTVQEYDSVTDTWTRKADMLVRTSQMASVVLDGKIFVIGGWLISTRSPYRTMQVYEPQTDTWTREADMPFIRAAFSGDVVSNRLYAIGGTDRINPCLATSTVYELIIKPPPPDFNGDGIIDSKDVCIMVEYWGTDEPLCDIAPPPFGDGIVDVQDLILLSEHLFEDYLAMPHWKLDEEEGSTANDSLGVHDGTLHGEPLWLPAGGRLDGALQLDGIDDYISTDFILNPSLGPFSVFAWIQGGGPGQVIISQLTGAGNIWLGLDAQSGTLMTGLVPPSSGWVANKPLVSGSIITDEKWHHIGFVWDGSYRILYVDGIEVAKDTAVQNPLKPADGGLYIGTDKTLGAGTFFSGLIDDVRIYNVALTAEQIAALAQ